MNVIRTIRNNWKKTVALIGVSAFGIHYANKKFNERLILKAYCLEAKKYGDEFAIAGKKQPRKVTVFLNPRARKGKGKDLYEKNVAPLLHLAGLEVTLVQTEYEGQAKKYMEVIEPTDAIIIAGGDGTISEVVTGLLRRPDEEELSKTPLGIIPVGYANTLAKSLCPQTDLDVVFLAEMAMSIIKEVTRPVDVIHIKGGEEKSVYAVTGLEWGSYTESEMRKTKNWYFGPLKHRLAYVVTALRHWPPFHQAQLSYSLPCSGCSRCYIPPVKPQWRWWHILLPPRIEVTKDLSGVTNEECGVVHTQSIATSQLSAKVSARAPSNSDETRSVDISVLNEPASRSQFISDGWNRLKNAPMTVGVQHFSVGEFTLEPTVPKDKEAWILIDNERFELMDIKCRILPQKLRFMFSSSFSVSVDQVLKNR